MTEHLARWSRGLASLALLLGLVAGVPAALVVLGGDPLPHRWDPTTLREVLLRPGDGTVLARLLALIGWAAWAVFVLSLGVELVNLLRSRSRHVVLPGLGGVQQWAAGLMLSVVALGAAAQLVHSVAPPTQVAEATSPKVSGTAPRRLGDLPLASALPSASTGAQEQTMRSTSPSPDGLADEPPSAVSLAAPGPGGAAERVHVVVSGDDLWSLAERYYGHGREWRTIAAANPDRLTGGPDRLRVGWRLVIPEHGRTPDHDVRVRRGDTLSAIAARTLGDAGRWPEIYHANRDQLSDPDVLPVGLSLRLSAKPSEHRGSDEDESEDQRDREATPSVEQPSATDRSSGAPRQGQTQSPPTSGEQGPTVDGGSADGSAEPSSRPGTEASRPPAPPEDVEGPSLLVPGLATVGGLLAAALLGAVAARRRLQLRRRPVGHRVVHPPPMTQPVEVELARRARPIGLRTLDRAARAVAATAVESSAPVPALRTASVSDEWLVLDLLGPTPTAPRCFVDTGGSWNLSADAVDGLRAVPGLAEAPRPWPLLVSLGADDRGAEVVIDLESRGLLAVEGDPDVAAAAMAALAVQLSCAPWNDELRLSLVGGGRLAEALAQHNVVGYVEVEPLLTRLERVVRERRLHAGGADARDLRLDPERAEAWTPEVVLVEGSLTPDQQRRLTDVVEGEPGLGLVAVVTGAWESATSRLVLGPEGTATLVPDGTALVPQTLPELALEPVVDLVAVTGSSETDVAPWWSGDEPSEPPPDNVTYLGRRHRREGDEEVDDRDDEDERRAAVQARIADAVHGTAQHPLLQLIGPVELLGAAGPPPPRAAKQCLEYCAWLLEHPGTSAPEMSSSLVVAEGTRRSNMSRLRTWLGNGPDGEPYLPDAYSGRIRLDPDVSSDWHQLQLLVGDGVDRASSTVLELGLRLVRGAPLADAAPVQWHWAEELRTDMISCVRDIGVELTRRAVADGNLDLARWSAARALVAAPGDELLLAERIRTEHRAGNAVQTERLCLQLAQQARALGVDLEPSTVDLIQEVMEGRVRARLA